MTIEFWLNQFVAIGALKINFIGFVSVGFGEDNLRGCLGYGAENLAVIRHLALNLLTHESTAKGGIHAKRLKAGRDNNYLTHRSLISQT